MFPKIELIFGAVLLATVMAYGTRLRPTGPIQWANRAAGMGYAVPECVHQGPTCSGPAAASWGERGH